MTDAKEVSVLEYARLKGIRTGWVYVLIREGKISARKVNRQWRIRLESEKGA